MVSHEKATLQLGKRWVLMVFAYEQELLEKAENLLDSIKTIKKWEYYLNDELFDDSRVVMWNMSIVYEQQQIFHGDISESRLNFLKLVSKTHKVDFLLYNEYIKPTYYIGKGRCYPLAIQLASGKFSVIRGRGL